MRILVTGALGFIGSHLCPYLHNHRHDILATAYNSNGNNLKYPLVKLNLLDKTATEEIVKKFKPDLIYHLAAQSLVMTSWKNPEETYRTNIFTTVNLLESVKKIDCSTKVIIFSSAGVYRSSKRKIKETDPFFPNSPYAMTKIFADYLSQMYFTKSGMSIIRIRPFDIIGPGKNGDVVSDISRRIVDYERGKIDKVHVGNLSAIRDFIDIDDAIRAIWLIAKLGQVGEVYNLCSGKGVKIERLVNILLTLSKVKTSVQFDPKLQRPMDEPVKVGSNARLVKLGWKPKVSLKESLRKVLEYWRNQNDKI